MNRGPTLESLALSTGSLPGPATNNELSRRTPWPRTLIVVAHPDDEYVLAATAYRICREIGGVIDQLLITNGEGGYRYASLAEAIYGVSLAREPDGRANLPAIRRQEVIRAGRILGVRQHYFLGQADSGFDGNCAEAGWREWDCMLIDSKLFGLLVRERYDFVLTLLPRADSHGHHRAAALLLLQAVERMPEGQRPAVLGAEAGRMAEEPRRFGGLDGHPITRTVSDTPAFAFDRATQFGHNAALNYSIVVNWVIAEHKSQGLFQTDCGKYDAERFWAFAITPQALDWAKELDRRLRPTAPIEPLSEFL